MDQSSDYGILAAQLAVSAASIAVSIFIPPPIGTLIAAAMELTAGAIFGAVQASEGDAISALSAVAMGAVSAIPFGELAKSGKFAEFGAKVSEKFPNASKALNKAVMNVEKLTSKLNAKLDMVAPDKLLAKVAKSWSKAEDDATRFEDAQLIMKKQTELETYGEIRETKKINSTTFNKDNESWIKCANFQETKFIDRNNIIGNLTIIYYVNNDSRLGRRIHTELNGNDSFIAVTIPNCRYKNDYVSGICRAKSWGSYYMRTWMIGKPGRSEEKGINTAILFGSEWRVDKKLKSILNQYKNWDKTLVNFSDKTAKKFLGKTKIGTKLLSYGDVYTKTTALQKGNASIIRKPLSKLKKGK